MSNTPRHILVNRVGQEVEKRLIDLSKDPREVNALDFWAMVEETATRNEYIKAWYMKWNDTRATNKRFVNDVMKEARRFRSNRGF